MSGYWTYYNAADEGDDHDDFVMLVVRDRNNAPLRPAFCPSCDCSTMVDGDGCLRCGAECEPKTCRTVDELWENVAAALFPAVCSFCRAEMIRPYSKIGTIDCGGYGNCERTPAKEYAL